jgi:hypothetical protein
MNCRVENGFVCEDEIDRIPDECYRSRTGVTYALAPFFNCPPKNKFTDEFNPSSEDGAPLQPDVCKEDCGDRRHFHLDACDDGNWDKHDGCD